jgi:phage terminase small subunit
VISPADGTGPREWGPRALTNWGPTLSRATRRVAKPAKKYPKAGGKRPRRQKSAKPGSKGKLTPKFLLVIDEYMTNGYNQYQALIAAGYAHGTARFNAATVFQRPEVKGEIEARMAELRTKYQLTEEYIIRGLMSIVDTNMGYILHKLRTNDWELSCLTIDERRAIDSFTDEFYTEGRGEDAKQVKKVKIGGVKTSDRKAALDSLARIQGMFKDKVEHSGTVDLAERIAAGRERAALKPESD